MSDMRPIVVPCYEDGTDRHDAEWWIGRLAYDGTFTKVTAACDIHLASLIRRTDGERLSVREIKE
jgi:hypothetical protein